MTAITLWQPWASLVALNLKRVETRSWAPNLKAPFRVAIHSSKHMGPLAREFRWSDEYRGAVDHAIRTGGLAVDDPLLALPLGCVLATVEVVDVVRTSLDGDPFTRACIVDLVEWWGAPNELEFGDYSPGRFAWVLDNLERLPAPVFATGARGLWEWAR